MILSVSRRTDIPNYYSQWFINRLKAGYLYVRNPVNTHQVSRIDLSPEVIDCIVFWTKNPLPMFPLLKELDGYPYYFQFTLTGYGKDMEPGVPHKKEDMIPVFKKLSETIGHERVIWRYDPILFTETYTEEYHLKAFSEIAKELKGYTDKVVISYLDLYWKMKHNMKGIPLIELSTDKLKVFSSKLAEIAVSNQMSIASCAEAIDLSDYGIAHNSCIDQKLIEHILGCRINVKKDRNQRGECGCVESVEIGSYDTCFNGCKYCYANFSKETVQNKSRHYNPNSPMLLDEIKEDDVITIRNMKSVKVEQMDLFGFL